MRSKQAGLLALVVGLATTAWAGTAAKAPAVAIKPVKIIQKMTGPQTATTTMYVAGKDKVRVEVQSPMLSKQMPMMTGDKMVIIVNGSESIMLNDKEKQAIKLPPGQNLAAMMMQQMGTLTPDQLDPKVIKQKLEAEGMKKTGTAKVGKEQCDLYSGSKVGKDGKPQGDSKVFLRQRDQLPVKVEIKSPRGNVDATMEWEPKFDAALFKVPAGYKTVDAAAIFGKGKGAPPQPGKPQ